MRGNVCVGDGGLYLVLVSAGPVGTAELEGLRERSGDAQEVRVGGT